MKVALICNAYIRNYGSILQSLACYLVLKEMVDEVEVVNYVDVPTGHAKRKIFRYILLPQLINPVKLWKKFCKIYHGKVDKDFLKIRQDRSLAMEKFVEKSFCFTKKCNSISDAAQVIQLYDKVMISSDQLWGPADILRGYHTLEHLPIDFPKVAYGTSFGVSMLPEFVKESAAHFLNNIQHVSVREQSGAQIVKNLTAREVPIVVDPTLLFDGIKWSEILGNRKPYEGAYIFAFFLGGTKSHRDFVKKVQKEMGLPIVSMQFLDEYLGSDVNFADVNMNNASPADFVNLIRFADIVITDSFHASVFSIQYHKKFFTFDRYPSKSKNSRNSRIESLFGKLGLQDRHLNGTEKVGNLLVKTIDYERIDEVLNSWRLDSRSYLKSALNIKNDRVSE